MVEGGTEGDGTEEVPWNSMVVAAIARTKHMVDWPLLSSFFNIPEQYGICTAGQAKQLMPKPPFSHHLHL